MVLQRLTVLWMELTAVASKGAILMDDIVDVLRCERVGVSGELGSFHWTSDERQLERTSYLITMTVDG